MKKVLVVSVLALTMASAAWAAGQFTAQLPPAATAYGTLQGGETLPVDTNLGPGLPQTVSVTVQQLRARSYVQATPLAAGTVVATSATQIVQLTPAGTLATLTIVWPAAPLDGQTFKIFSTQTVTTLTNTLGAGQSLNSALTTLTANTPIEYFYQASTLTWFRT